MELEGLLETKEGKKLLQFASFEKPVSGPVDLSRAREVKVSQETYLEAQSKGMTLSELLETAEYDPSEMNSPLDAFERQLAVHDIRVGGNSPVTVELFYQGAPALLPEFMIRLFMLTSRHLRASSH